MPETGRTGLLPRCSGAANGGYSPRKKARGAFATPSAPCLSDGVGTRGVPTHRRNALAARRRTRGLVWSSPLRTLQTDLGGHHRKFLDTESPIQGSGRSHRSLITDVYTPRLVPCAPIQFGQRKGRMVNAPSPLKSDIRAYGEPRLADVIPTSNFRSLLSRLLSACETGLISSNSAIRT